MISELQWIQTLKERLPNKDVLEHDAFFDPETRQVITTDLLVEGVHFSREFCSWQDIGWKAIAVNLSDLAATGAQPKWFVVSLSLPESLKASDLKSLYDGMLSCCDTYGGQIIGGDTTRGTTLSINVTAIGEVPTQQPIGRRNTARVGDIVFLSPPQPGLNALGLWALQKGQAEHYPEAVSLYRRPLPQLAASDSLAKMLQPHKNTLKEVTLMDTSDGLADATIQIARCADVDIILETASLQSHPELKTWEAQTDNDSEAFILYGGEDFGLFTCLPPKQASKIDLKHWREIGHVSKKSAEIGQAFIKTPSGLSALEASRCFQHFKESLPCR